MPPAIDNDIAVRCRGVTKTYGTGPAQVVALSGVDLDVRYGELLMLMGPSGCGKTTLVSIIAAIIDQDGGCCEVLGHDLQIMRRQERGHFRGQSIGFVFQVFNLLPALTARENVAIPLLLNGVPRKLAMDRAGGLLQSVGLGERMKSLPEQLSGGQQQRVAIARALVHEPKLIICDEPTSSLDHQAGLEVMAILRGLAQQPDRALVIVTHDSRILAFADRVVNMDDGRIVTVTAGTNEENL